MSWQLASFVVLGAVLVGGFAWYERSRPPSQTVALVAALAALAVAGRLAFAAIPNVVATTDIVLIAGYSIGAAPGFAVGALAGVVSNFWLGQGPWTPWQMAGWGLVGVAGAGLRVLTRRRAGRMTLATACGLAGIAYGALLNFSLMASYGGELSFDRFVALEGRAVPFDAAHAIGNVTLALLAGPAMVRMLQRFRERFEWRRAPAPRRSRPAGAAGAVTALLALAICLPLLAPTRAEAADVDAAAGWLVTAQNGDGGFGTSPGAKSSATMTSWAMLGLEAAGRNPLDVSHGGATAVGYLTRRAGDITSTGDLARTVLALVGAGVEPRQFANRNLLRELRGRMRKNGSFEGWPNATAFSILALRGAGSPAGLEQSLTWLRKVQNDDGGWGVVPGAHSDPDSTGAVLQVIHNQKARSLGIRYLRRHQSPGGGFAIAGSQTINSQSTAWAVQGMLAAGVDPDSIHEGGGTGPEYLDRRQAADGHFRYSKSSDQTPVWVTGQVLAAAAGDAYPLAAAPRQPQSSQPAPSDTTTPTAPFPSPATVPGAGGSLPTSPGLGKLGSGAGAIPPAGREAEAPPGGAFGTGRAAGRPGAAVPEQVASARLEPEDDGGPPPAAPIGIGAGTALLAGCGTVFLGRRRGW